MSLVVLKYLAGFFQVTTVANNQISKIILLIQVITASGSLKIKQAVFTKSHLQHINAKKV